VFYCSQVNNSRVDYTAPKILALVAYGERRYRGISFIELLFQLHRDYLRERRRGPNKRESISRQAGSQPVLPADLNGRYASR